MQKQAAFVNFWFWKWNDFIESKARSF